MCYTHARKFRPKARAGSPASRYTLRSTAALAQAHGITERPREGGRGKQGKAQQRERRAPVAPQFAAARATSDADSAVPLASLVIHAREPIRHVDVGRSGQLCFGGESERT